MLVSLLISANVECIHTRLNSHGDNGGVIGGGGGSGGGAAKGSMPAWPEILGGACTPGPIASLVARGTSADSSPAFSLDIIDINSIAPSLLRPRSSSSSSLRLHCTLKHHSVHCLRLDPVAPAPPAAPTNYRVFSSLPAQDQHVGLGVDIRRRCHCLLRTSSRIMCRPRIKAILTQMNRAAQLSLLYGDQVGALVLWGAHTTRAALNPR